MDKTELNWTVVYEEKVIAFDRDCKADCQEARGRFLVVETGRTEAHHFGRSSDPVP